MLIKSRARRTLIIQVPADAQAPTVPLTRMSVRRSRTVRNALGEPTDQRVAVEVRLPGAITILPGQQVDVPRSLKSLDQFKNLIASRELVVLRDDPPPAKRPAKPAKTPAKAEPNRRTGRGRSSK